MCKKYGEGELLQGKAVHCLRIFLGYQAGASQLPSLAKIPMSGREHPVDWSLSTAHCSHSTAPVQARDVGSPLQSAGRSASRDDTG